MTFPQILTDIIMERVRAGLSDEIREKFDLYDLELVYEPIEEDEMAGFGGIFPFAQITTKTLPGGGSVGVTVTGEAINWDKQVFFFLLDVIPEYIQKTFGVDGDGKFPVGDARRAVRLNEDIPTKDVEVAVIVYNMSEHHLNFAHTLMQQLESLVPRAQVVMMPVQG